LRVRAHFVVVEWRRVRREARSFWRICRAGGAVLLEWDWEREARAAEDDCEASVSATSAVCISPMSAVGSDYINCNFARLSVCRTSLIENFQFENFHSWFHYGGGAIVGSTNTDRGI
jgi:hypothetical protein